MEKFISEDFKNSMLVSGDQSDVLGCVSIDGVDNTISA